MYTSEVPQQQKQYQLQGMQYNDIVRVLCTIQHFKEASVLSYLTGQKEFEEYYPKIGDLMYFPWNKTFYEIVNVKMFNDGSSFLTVPITFEFILKTWQPGHEDVDVMQQNTDDMNTISRFAELAESFNIENKTADVSADMLDEEKNLSFSTSGDVLSVNNSTNGLDINKSKSVTSSIFTFDPFE